MLKRQFKILKYNVKLQKIENELDKIESANLKIIDIKLNFKSSFKVPPKSASLYVLKSLNIAHLLALRDDVKGIINCPIDKKLLLKKKVGVTEILAKKCKIKNKSEVMLIMNEKLSVCPITIHIDLKEVSRSLNEDIIIDKIKTINNYFQKYFKKKPKIGVLGLNPHNAEFRKGSEEINIIQPAILKLKKQKFNINGPLISDTLFIKDYKKYDVIVGMYHDQVLTPFKSIFDFNAINVTLGLKYLRVSPDHGVAKDLICKNKAESLSLVKCINFVNRYGK